MSGTVAAVVMFLLLATGGRWDLGPRNYTTNFLDLQGRAMLHGRLWVPAHELGIEAICEDTPTIEATCPDDRAHVYFGPTLSVLRLPVLALTDRFDGRLTLVSMLLGVAALSVGVLRLWRTARWWSGRRAPPGRLDVALAALLPIAATCGTVVWFLGSKTVVYHEAILWGVALSVLGYDAVLRVAASPSWLRIIVAGWWCALALLTRASVGIGPPLALGLLASIGLARSWLGRDLGTTGARAVAEPPALHQSAASPASGAPAVAEPPALHQSATRELRWRWLAAGTAAGIAVLGYVAINLAKFGTLFSLPLDRQLYSVINPSREAALAANGGSLFGLRFIPTTFWQYLRPGGISTTGWFPYVDHGATAAPLGGATFDTIGRASSLPAASPWLAALAVVGLVLVWRRLRPGGATALACCLVGAGTGVLTALSIAFIAQRYVGDLLPPAFLLAAFGTWALAGKAQDHPRLGVTIWVVGAALVAWSIWANGSLGILEQRLYTPRSQAELAAFVGTQDSWPALAPAPVRRSDGFPARADTTARAATRLVVVDGGRCAALYVSDGTRWMLAELAAPRHRRIEIDAAELTPEPLPLASGVTIRRRGNDVIVHAGEFDSRPRRLRSSTVVDLVADPVTGELQVRIGGADVLDVKVESEVAAAAVDQIGADVEVPTPTLDAQRGC